MGMFDDLRKLDAQPFQATLSTPPNAKPAAPTVPPKPAPPMSQSEITSQNRTDSAVAAANAPSPADQTRVKEARVIRSTRPATPTKPSAPDEQLSLALAEPPYRKDTFLFTNDEFEALEDLKLRLRRSLDVKVTKNDLARCAIAYLVADVKRVGEASTVIAPLENRRGR